MPTSKRIAEISPARKKANRFFVRIRVEMMDGEIRETDSKMMGERAANKLRAEWMRDGHPEAVVKEDAPAVEAKPGRMSGR